MAEMNEKRGAKDDRGSLSRRLRSGRATPPELLLLLTAFVWGGYHPCMRMLLTDTSERGSAPTPSEINLARFSLVAALFVAQAACADAACFRRRGRARGGGGGALLMTTREEPFDATRSLVSAERGEEKRRPGETFGKLERAASLGNQNAAFLWGAACELAFWHFVTIALQSTGVAFVGATRAGFIAASTTMTVPFVSALFGESVSTNTWIAAFVAMAGAALIVFSSASDDETRVSVGNAAFSTTHETRFQSKRFHDASSRVFLGDALTTAGSVAWAVFLFRLSRLAPRFPRLPLAVARSACMTLFVAAWWLVDTFVSSRSNHVAASVSVTAYERETDGGEKPPPFRWLASPRAAALTAFMAIGPGWACAWWQTTAQASVSAARAAVLMSTTPLWGAVWAAAAMGETMDWVGWLGGLTVVGGTALVALER